MRVIPAALLLALGVCAAAPLANAATPARNYVVFFKEWSAAIDKPATTVIRAAAKAAKADANATVLVTGYADTVGSSQANVYLTELRAQVVADQLAHDGLAPDRIKQAAAGAVPAVGTQQESRRVTISLSASP